MSLDDLASDVRKIAVRSQADMKLAVRDGLQEGNKRAKSLARGNIGHGHARKYPGKFSAEMHRGKGLFGNAFSGEYGPRHQGQGKLAPILENGSRRGNRPQHNMAASFDLTAPSFAMRVHRLPDKWFWPES